MVSVNQIRSVGELASAGFRQLKGLSQDGCQVFVRKCGRPFQYAPKQFSTEGSSYIKVKDGNIVSSFCKKTMDFPSCIDGRQQHHFHLTKYDEYGKRVKDFETLSWKRGKNAPGEQHIDITCYPYGEAYKESKHISFLDDGRILLTRNETPNTRIANDFRMFRPLSKSHYKSGNVEIDKGGTMHHLNNPDKFVSIQDAEAKGLFDYLG